MNQCIEWEGAIGSHGYGNLRRNKKYLRAHRVAWEDANCSMYDHHGCRCTECKAAKSARGRAYYQAKKARI